jgi:hypothetical protein
LFFFFQFLSFSLFSSFFHFLHLLLLLFHYPSPFPNALFHDNPPHYLRHSILSLSSSLAEKEFLPLFSHSSSSPSLLLSSYLGLLGRLEEVKEVRKTEVVMRKEEKVTEEEDGKEERNI